MRRPLQLPSCTGRSPSSVRCLVSVAQHPAAKDNGGESSSSTSSASQTPMWRRVLSGVVKGVLMWVPATLFWMQMVAGVPFFDLRTEEEAINEEQELQRLERFFDVQMLPEEECIVEWQAKEEAINQVVEKLVKSQRFLEMLERGFEAESGVADASQASWSSTKKMSAQEVESRAQAIAVSYVLKPAPASEVDDESETQSPMSHSSSGYATWSPRLVVQHRSGALALVILGLEHVQRAKDREERWTCTHLRVELIAGPGGESFGEPLCDLSGHVPHGVRYLRI